MAERRQAHRREPIEVQVRDRVLEAHPLPWMKRNDLGNEIMRQYSELLNSSLRAVRGGEDEDAPPQLQMYLNDKLTDPVAVLRMGYPRVNFDEDFFQELDYDEILELIYASMDVNQLDSLRHLVDPNSLTPTNDGGTSSEGQTPTEDSPSPQSSPDSDSQD